MFRRIFGIFGARFSQLSFRLISIFRDFPGKIHRHDKWADIGIDESSSGSDVSTADHEAASDTSDGQSADVPSNTNSAPFDAEASSSFKTEAECIEALVFDDFRMGEIQEEVLREALDYYAEVREQYGLGPISKRPDC